MRSEQRYVAQPTAPKPSLSKRQNPRQLTLLVLTYLKMGLSGVLHAIEIMGPIQPKKGMAGREKKYKKYITLFERPEASLYTR